MNIKGDIRRITAALKSCARPLDKANYLRLTSNERDRLEALCTRKTGVLSVAEQAEVDKLLAASQEQQDDERALYARHPEGMFWQKDTPGRAFYDELGQAIESGDETRITAAVKAVKDAGYA